MDIEYLRDFLELAKNRNFTRTANHLGISQPALSKRVATIEQELGAKLFSRSNQGTELTPAGSMFVGEAQKIIYDYDFAVQRIRAFSSSNPERIRIELFRGYKPTDDLMITLQHRLSRDGRAIELTINDIQHDPLLQIREEKVDLGLLVHPISANLTGLTSIPIITEPLVAVVFNDGLFADRSEISVTELTGNVVWTIRDPGSLQFALRYEELIHQHGAMPRFLPIPWLNAQNSYTGIAFADSGVSITFASVAKFSLPITAANYHVVRFVEDDMVVSVNAVWRESGNPSCGILAETMQSIIAETDLSRYWK